MNGFAGIVQACGPLEDRTVASTLVQPLLTRDAGPIVTQTDGIAGFAMTHSVAIPDLDHRSWIVGDVRLDGRKDLIARFDPSQRRTIAGLLDLELILRGYQLWGDECLDGLTGDFSFAIWDGQQHRLLCARDPLGVKPFFFARGVDCLVFSNTFECVRAHPGISKAFDPIAISDFLLFGAMKDTSATAFSEMKRLPAGHFLIYEGGALKVRRFWTPNWGEPQKYRRATQVLDHFREVLQQAVDERVTSSQTGILMSGGLDSTAVAASARGSQSSLKGFTVVYDHLIPDEERRYSGLAASFLGIPIEYLAADNFELYQEAGDLEALAPEPQDEPLLKVFIEHLRQAQGFSQVALTGQGGDGILATPPELGLRMLRNGQFQELFTGAWQYIGLRRRAPPLGFRGSFKRMFSGPSAAAPTDYPGWLNPDFESKFDLRDRFAQNQTIAAPQSAQAVILDPFWSYLLEGYDSGFTGVPLEVRHPLLDLRVIRFCLSLNPVPWHIDKTLVRVAMKGRLPPAIRFRPKSPVAVDPIAIRLANCKWIDTWRPCDRLSAFVVREKVPQMKSPTGETIGDLRPLALNRWLQRVEREGA